MIRRGGRGAPLTGAPRRRIMGVTETCPIRSRSPAIRPGRIIRLHYPSQSDSIREPELTHVSGLHVGGTVMGGAALFFSKT